MVGKIIFKNFETGSYEYWRITAYEGTSYADIMRGEDFSSCLVSPDGGFFECDYMTSPDSPRCNLSQIERLCRAARELLQEDVLVTMADFCIDEGSLKIRKSSYTAGLYEPVSFVPIFSRERKALFKLCAQLDYGTYLEHSAMCFVLNYCMRKLYDIEEEVFGLSGKGLYINAALFASDRASVKFLGIPSDMRRLMGSKRRGNLRPRRAKTVDIPRELMQIKNPSPHERLLADLCRAKRDALCMAYQKMHSSKLKGASLALYICEQEDIIQIIHNFAAELVEYVSNYEFFFDAPSHIKYLSLEDALCIASETDLSDRIFKNAAARSAAMKYMERIPSSDYIDSMGRVYNF